MGEFGDLRVEREHAVDVGIGQQHRADLVRGFADVGGAGDREGLVLPAGQLHREARFVAAVDQPDVSVFVDDAEHAGDAGGGEPLAGGQAGDLVGLAEVRDRAERPAALLAGVDREHEEAGLDGGADRVLQRVGVGEGDDQDVVALGDGVVDEADLGVDVAVAVIAQLNTEFALGGLCAGGDLVPEGVADAAVGDHGDAEVDLGERGGLALGADDFVDAAEVGGEHGEGDDEEEEKSAPVAGDAAGCCCDVHSARSSPCGCCAGGGWAASV